MSARLPDAKRLFDLAVAVPAFVLSLPVQGLVGLLVIRKLGRPMLFKQARPGLHAEPFAMRKFRSMLPVDEALGQVDDASRMTNFGRVLRSTSLDELPTLWNVIRGDMSLVGPRPLLMHYLPLYSAQQAQRHDVRPGLTGLAQISGRNGISWQEKFELDVRYVQERNLVLDLKILMKTVAAVIGRRGVTANGHVSMEQFTGTGEGVEA